MKNIVRISQGLALALIFVFVAKPLIAPSQTAQNPQDAKTKISTPDSLLNAKLESEYATGLAALKTRNWTRAVLAFEKVLQLDRNYRDARKRLTVAQKGLSRESAETIIARYYAEGVTAIKNNDLDGALAALEKVHKLNPNYREVASLRTEVENKLAARTAPWVSRVDVDSLYQDAMRAFEHEDWLQAVIAFEKIQVLQPNYRDVIDRLAQVRAKLLAVGKTREDSPRRTNDGLYFYVGGALAALVVLPLLGSVVLSPAARARIYLLRGDYIAAAQLYEKVLERHPNKVKLYPMLANIYLLLGRNDKKALKAYKMVLQLNLTTRNRDEINALVAQNYLLEGRTDWDAIEVLESALKAERRRLGQGQG